MANGYDAASNVLFDLDDGVNGLLGTANRDAIACHNV